MKNRDGEESCKAAPNRLRKIWRVLLERSRPTPFPEHAKQQSNASFETKHRPLAAFLGLPSWLRRVAQTSQFSENKITHVARDYLPLGQNGYFAVGRPAKAY